VPETSATAAPGQLLAGRYRLEELIASGGMAQVWRATDEVLQRRVAVKILHTHLAQDESFVARFRVEAVAAARLRHSSIVSIYDTCSDDGLQAIVMELVQGQNLRQRLDQVGTLSPREAVHIGAEVADALGAAHRAGLVHRDVKPANIMLCDDHRVVVTDFGIAKVRGDADLTQTGLLIGSVKYLSPEQVEGKVLDGRSDIYSLAVVLYEGLCGRPPFAGESDAATALARLQSNPPLPRQLKPSIPRGLENVIMRGMARAPDQRYQTASDFRAALLAAPLKTEQETPPPQATSVAPRPIAPPPRTPPAPRAQPRPQPAPSFTKSERNWLIPTLVIILIALCLALAGVLFGRTQAGQDFFGRAKDAVGENQSGSSDQQIATIPIASVQAFDPQGGDGENDGDAKLVVDGDPSTEWSTEGYDRRDLRPKTGVGLVATLDGSFTLDELAVASPTNDWAAEVYVLDGPAAPTLDGWGDPVAQAEGIAGDTVFDLGGTQGSAVLLWITDLGDEPPRTHARIGSLELRGS
jgi:eukaryotic-like serine/threonine-protein kinase